MSKKTNIAKNNNRMKIVDKVIKLLAKADSTTHDAEATTARELAAKLMAKENIALSDLIQKNTELSTVDQVQNVKFAQPFDRKLASFIARFNNCAMVTYEGGTQAKSKFVYCGMPHDIEASIYMLDIVKQQRTAAYAAYSEEYIARHGKERWVADETDWRRWHNGYTSGVYNKLKSLTTMAEEKVQEMGLVPISGYDACMKWYEDNMNANVRTNKAKTKSGSAAGFEAGKNVAIHQGIATDSDKKLIA